MNKEELTQERLKEILSYDMESGVFTWLVKPCKRMAIGSKAGSIYGDGYYAIRIGKRRYTAHRLAFLYVNGRFPENDVDHINGVRNDNRFCNLRECTRTENLQNLSASGRGATGLLGVSFHKRWNKYQVNIRAYGKHIHIGYFDNPHDANEAYLAAKKELHLFNPVPRD